MTTAERIAAMVGAPLDATLLDRKLTELIPEVDELEHQATRVTELEAIVLAQHRSMALAIRLLERYVELGAAAGTVAFDSVRMVLEHGFTTPALERPDPLGAELLPAHPVDDDEEPF